MEFRNRANQTSAARPVRTTQQNVEPETTNNNGGGMNTNMSMRQPSHSSKRKWLMVAVAVLAVVLLVLGGFYAKKAFFSSDNGVKSDKYQALFLTNGQVYFGHLSDTNNDYVALQDIYYLQVQQSVQPEENKDQQQQPQVSLTKLGGELHGPEDSMHVARDQVLFWENLKDDSKVVQAIKEHKKQ